MVVVANVDGNGGNFGIMMIDSDDGGDGVGCDENDDGMEMVVRSFLMHAVHILIIKTPSQTQY